MDPAREIRFDGWTLRPATGELLRDGFRTRLQQQPLTVLLTLLDRPGELVTREELIARLWPRGVVDFDTALNTAVRRLRIALCDQAEAPRYVETIQRRGYRFIGKLEAAPPVEAPSNAAAPALGRESRRVRAGWLAVAAAALVAVIAGASGRLAGGPDSVERTPPAAGPPVTPEAQDRFRLAEHFFQRRGPGDLDRAMEQYQQALVAQPDYAEALAGMAGVYWIQTVEGLTDPQQGLSRLRDAAERALALDPGLADAHLRLSQYRSVIGDRAEATWHARMAASLKPEDPLVLAFAASRAAFDGRLDEAVSLQRHALELEPLSRVSRYNLAWFLVMDGRIAEASQELQALEELGPDAQQPREALAAVMILEGRAAEARELARSWPEGRERSQVLAIAERVLGDRADAERALHELITCCGTEDPLRVAEVFGSWGDTEAAFTWLTKGLSVGRLPPWQTGPRREAWMAVHSPYLSTLHEDPRWASWVDAVQAPSFPERVAALK